MLIAPRGERRKNAFLNRGHKTGDPLYGESLLSGHRDLKEKGFLSPGGGGA